MSPTDPTRRSRPPRWVPLALLAALYGCGPARAVTAPGTTTTARGTAPAAPLVAPQSAATFTRFAVAADHPEASNAGAEVLAAGGTAADAAAAAMLALGVASPASSGLGGGGFALYYRASDQSVTFLDFRETAPAATTATSITAPTPPGGDAGAPPRAMGPTVGVPGEPRGIEELLRRFGSLNRERVVAPAVRLAEEGFTPSEYLATLSQRFVPLLRRDALGRTWVPEGAEGIRAGVTLRNPALAQTLRTFAAQGARPFYEGPIAEEIVRAARAAGGSLTLDDLRGYRVAERPPLSAEHYGHRWVTAPPESAGGYTLLASVALMERWIPPTNASPSEADALHALAESWRGPFLDRARYFGDPDFVRVPVDALLAPPRVAARASRFDMVHARPSADYDLPLPERAAGAPATVPVGAGTSHVCVVDAEGNVASVTTTVNIPFGAGVSVGGFWLNNELDDFTLPPTAPPTARGDVSAPALAGGGGTANQPAPGRRPVSTMTPTIVFDGARPSLCIGGSGGTRITTAVTQVAWRVVALRASAAEAVAHPRIHQAAQPETLSVEPTAPEAVVAELRARGHQTEPLRYGAMVQAIRIARGPAGTRLDAASDARKGGRPAGR